MSIGIFSINTNEIENAVNNFLRQHKINHSIDSIQNINIQGKNDINIVALNPIGYIIMSNSVDELPVYGYSFTSKFDLENAIFIEFIAKIIELNRFKNSTTENRQEWDRLIESTDRERPVEYWPTAGTTTSGGWVETSWEQGAPYNMFCPVDPYDQTQKSYAGCPSVAMAMIVDYHRQTNNTSFSQEDNYVTPYGYSIGVDHASWDFLSFPEINSYISQIQSCYDSDTALDDTLKAALIFACGVAAKQQSYTDAGSGTYFTPQIENGYKRFGFSDAVTLLQNDIDLHERIIQNMKLGLPAQMCALIASGGGHQIIIDGYNTNDEFHFNFGWGGTADGWYSFPLSNMPSGLNIFSSVVLDINRDPANYTDFSFISPSPPQEFSGNDNISISLAIDDLNDVSEVRYYIDDNQWYCGANAINYSYNVCSLDNGYHRITAVVTNNDSISNYKDVYVNVNSDSLIYEEKFDTGLNGWTCGDSLWQNSDNSLISYNTIDAVSNGSVTLETDFQNVNSVILSPEIAIPFADEITTEFYIAYPHQYTNNPSLRLKAKMSDSDNWMTLWVSTDQTGMFCWTKQTVDITAFMASNTQFAFEVSGTPYADVSIDDFRIYTRTLTDIDDSIVKYDKVDLNNYPNPFNPETTITFSLPDKQHVRLSVYNIKGQKVASLINSACERGENSIVWKGIDDNGKDQASGVYFSRLEYGNKTEIKKMLLLK